MQDPEKMATVPSILEFRTHLLLQHFKHCEGSVCKHIEGMLFIQKLGIRMWMQTIYNSHLSKG